MLKKLHLKRARVWTSRFELCIQQTISQLRLSSPAFLKKNLKEGQLRIVFFLEESPMELRS